MSDFNQFTIPFGKYLDPNSLGNLKLIKEKVIEENAPLTDTLYIIEDTDNDTLYCVYEPETDEPNYHGSIARSVMESFLRTELGNNYTVELLKPKNQDWLPTHYLARIHVA